MSCECHIVGRTAYDGVCLTPLDRFSKLDMSTALGLVPGLKMSASEISRRELSEDVSFGIGTGTLLVVEQSSLGKTAPGVWVWYTPSCAPLAFGRTLRVRRDTTSESTPKYRQKMVADTY